MRLFLDANVVFSAAHNSQGNARALFQLAAGSWCRLLSSPYALEEARRNIALRYPAVIRELDRLIAALEVVPEGRPERISRALLLGVPEKDAPILAAAAQAGADCLVTGDKRHFGHLYDRKLESLTVRSPAETLKYLLKLRTRR